jgi:nucleoside-diphosphate-sugar epimerase
VRRDVELVRASLDDRSAVERAVRRIKPEWIFHLAAHGAYSWETDVDRILATNVGGTVNLVRAGLRAGFDALVNAGSSSEYGFKKKAPGEREWVEPNSHYAVAKVAATHFCRLTAQRERVKIATLRLYSVYGPWEDPGRLMPTMVVQGLAGKLPPLVDPRVARDYVYVDDVSEAFVRAAAKPHPEPGRSSSTSGAGSWAAGSRRRRAPRARDRRATALGDDAEPRLGHERLGVRQPRHPPRARLEAALHVRARLSPARRMDAGGPRTSRAISQRGPSMSDTAGSARPRRSVLATAGVAAIVLLAPVWVLHLVPRPEPRDFYVDWMAARDLVAGRPLYRSMSEEQAAVGVVGTFNVGHTTHPPTAGLVALPLAGLDYRTALLVWNLVGLAILVATIRLACAIAGRPRARLDRGRAAHGLGSAVGRRRARAERAAPGFRRRLARTPDADVVAGIALGPAALKVHPGLLLVYLSCRALARGHVAAATVLALAGAVVAIAGPSAWTRFVAFGLPELRRWWPNWMGVSLTGFATRLFMPDEKTIPLGRSPAVAAVLVAGGTLAALGAAAASCARDRANLDRAFALVTTLSLLVSTVAWPH